MKLRCWPGAIAWLNSCNDAPQNIGALFQVGQYAGMVRYPTGATMAAWRCTSISPIDWPGQGSLPPGTEFIVADSHLTPISPPPEALEVDRQIDEFVAAVESLSRQLEQASSAS